MMPIFQRKRYTRDRLVKAYIDVFRESEDGQLILHDLIKRGHLFHSTHVPSDPHLSSIREGERNLLLHILSVCQFTHADVLKMMDEQKTYQIQPNEEDYD